MKKVFIVIPAYNEEKVIVSVIASIKKEGFKNIVCRFKSFDLR